MSICLSLISVGVATFGGRAATINYGSVPPYRSDRYDCSPFQTTPLQAAQLFFGGSGIVPAFVAILLGILFPKDERPVEAV